MDLALTGLRVFQGKVQQWGAQELEFSLGREGSMKARLKVVLARGVGKRDGLGLGLGLNGVDL